MKSGLKNFLLIVGVMIMNDTYTQTTISGGNVSGVWTKAGSPYKINGNIIIPNGQTLQIEPGVRIEFAQFKHMKVDGRILALGGSSSVDSIWFTKQNQHDTGSWKGVKFIRTNNANDTSIFKYCVFRNCKSLYDTALAYRSGGITILGFGKVKFEKSTFYRNEANVGACIHITVDAFTKVLSCKFKYNKVSIFGFDDGSSLSVSYVPVGAAISIDYGSNAIIDSCSFEKQKRGKDYTRYPSTILDGSVIDVQGNTYYKKKSYATITNSDFDGNDGIALRASDRAIVRVHNCTFINAPANKFSWALILATSSLTELYTYNCKMQYNQSTSLIRVEYGASYYSVNDLISNNYNYGLISAHTGNSPFSSYTNTKVLNNTSSVEQKNNGQFISTELRSCLIANNTSPTLLLPAQMYNSTVVNNYCSYRLMLLVQNSELNIYKNNILWGNKCDSSNGKQITIVQIQPEFNNNTIENDTDNFVLLATSGFNKFSNNNFSFNPLFKSPSAGIGSSYDASIADFGLRSTCNSQSPGINAGSKDTLGLKLTKLDIGGNLRYYEDRIDMGCYESNEGSPEISITAEPMNDTMCQGERPAELSLAAFGKGLNFQWQSSNNNGSSWANMNGKTQGKLNLGLTNPQQNGIIYRALLSGTCDADTSSAVHVITHELPVVNLGYDTAVCQYSKVMKKVINAGDVLWHTGSTDSAINLSVTRDSVWWCQITNPEACKSRDSILIQSLALPAVNLGPDQNLHRLKKLELHAGSGQKSYLWDDQSTLVSRSFFGQDLGVPGTYTLWAEVTNNNSCKNRDSINITVHDNSSVHSSLATIIRLYPQPANDVLNIELPLEDGNNKYQILSSEGKVLMEGQITGNNIRFTVSDLDPGVYMIRIIDNEHNLLGYLKWVKG